MSIARLTWKDPTTRTNGAALAASEIAFISVWLSSDNGQNYDIVGHAAAGQQTFDQAIDAPGTYLFRLIVEDTQVPPVDSAPSVAVSCTQLPPPLPPPAVVTEVAVTLLVDVGVGMPAA